MARRDAGGFEKDFGAVFGVEGTRGLCVGIGGEDFCERGGIGGDGVPPVSVGIEDDGAGAENFLDAGGIFTGDADDHVDEFGGAEGLADERTDGDELSVVFGIFDGDGGGESQGVEADEFAPSGFGREAVADFVAEGFAVDGFAFEAGAGGFDYGAHLFQGVGTGFGDGFIDGAVEFLVGGSGGKIFFDEDDFLFFFFGEVEAAAFGELFGGFVALFDERLQDLKGFEIVERTHLFDFFVLERGFDHAEDAEAELVLFLHGGGEIGLDAVDVAHFSPRSGGKNNIRGAGVGWLGIAWCSRRD
jgi:hypothetical protein